MGSETSKTSDRSRLVLNIVDKIGFIRRNVQLPYNNKFELPDGSYSISDIQDNKTWNTHW